MKTKQHKIIKSPYFLLVIATLIWGGNFVIGRAIAEYIPPYTLSFLRWVAALVVFLPIAWSKIYEEKDVIKENWLPLLWMAVTGIAGFNTLLYIALHYTTSINASLVNTTAPIIIAVLSFLIIGERLKRNQIIGVILSVVGVIIIFSQGSLEVLLGLTFNAGDLIMVAAVIVWGLYSILVRHYVNRLSMYATLAAAMVMGVVVLFPFFIWESFYAGKHIIWNLYSSLTIVYVGVLASVVAFVAWNTAVGEIGAAKAGIFLNLIAIFAAIFAILFNNEQLTWYQVVGGSVAVLGVYLSTRQATANKKVPASGKLPNKS
ncbi:MAG: DMT family transporter [Bacillota bacterium]|nr:DMT family transporter [Bacillota bacterium]